MSNLTELKEEDIVIKSLTEFTTKLQDRDVSIILNKFKNSKKQYITPLECIARI